MTMRVGTYVTLSLVYTCIHLAHICLSCVLLLNGWTPLTVRKRAELAEISALGEVINTYKDQRTVDDTYTAEFRLLGLYKGHDLVSNVTKSVAPGNVYNVSNFGSKAKCYADVETGNRYIVFLTLYDGQLSAQYDDLFGAAAQFTKMDEEEILAYLGWDPWTPWSPCSAVCGGGRQVRSRDCPRENASACIGVDRELRTCNLFQCEGSHDLLTLMGVRNCPLGVTKNRTRPSTYVISKHTKLSLPASQIYDVTLPTTFSLLMKLKIESRKQKGYFFVISDIHGKQQLAVFLGRKLKFQYLGNNYGFKINVLDNKWHTLGLSVDGSHVILYADCDITMKRRLRSIDEYLGTNLMMSIGPYFSKYGKPFQGEVEQLFINADPRIASKQCGLPILNPNKDDSIVNELTTASTPTLYSTPYVKPLVFGSDWSAWSACSTTCGQGRQTRALYCRANIVSAQSCDPMSPLPTQTRQCYLGNCQGCYPPCQNGGTCLSGNICWCGQEFSGAFCQSRKCLSACLNGGVCNGDGVCQCPANFTGSYCQHSVCQPPCQNGGQCVLPGVCACPSGYSGPSCKNSCTVQCHNGGECVGLNVCRCQKYYTGLDCSIPLCKRGCHNGGQCVAPNYCVCPVGFYGKRCQKVRCRPSCKNGGVCVLPDQCLCKAGYHGSRCQKVNCRIPCMNEGTCIAPNICHCPPLYYGRRCHREKCQITCLNGGRCRKSQCRCPPGFSGRRCERRTCRYEQYLVPYRRTYRKVVQEDYPVQCGTWSHQTCFRTRLKYVLITKDTYRTAYRCI